MHKAVKLTFQCQSPFMVFLLLCIEIENSNHRFNLSPGRLPAPVSGMVALQCFFVAHGLVWYERPFHLLTHSYSDHLLLSSWNVYPRNHAGEKPRRSVTNSGNTNVDYTPLHGPAARLGSPLSAAVQDQTLEGSRIHGPGCLMDC
jgi:hypothetical protein